MGKRKDWSIYENEYLKVIKKSDSEIQQQYNARRKNKTIFWDCQCKGCGKVFPVSQQNLTHTKSCGCSRLKIFNHDDEVGKTYGDLTVLELDKETTIYYNSNGMHRGPYYKCKCKCGSIKTYRLSAIKCGHIKSCGCSMFNNPLYIDDLTGQRFGKLVVKRRDLDRDLREREEGIYRVHWLCDCDCGNKDVSISAKCLKTGETKSCGCLKSEILAERNRIFKPKQNKTYQYKNNPYDDINENTVRVYDENYIYSFLVDKQDLEFISQWYWRKDINDSHRHKYWITNAKKKDIEAGYPTTLRLHQMIAERKYGSYDKNKYMPDHLSRDVDDNRRCNLILKSNIENTHNRSLSINNKSGKTGVYQHYDGVRWCAHITVNYKTIFLGVYNNIDDAIKARKKAEIEYGFTCDDIFPDYDFDAERIS